MNDQRDNAPEQLPDARDEEAAGLEPGPVTRRQRLLSGIPVDTNQQLPTRRPIRSSAATEDGLEPQPRQSIASLTWDDYQEPPNFNSTAFSVPQADLTYQYPGGEKGSVGTDSNLALVDELSLNLARNRGRTASTGSGYPERSSHDLTRHTSQSSSSGGSEDGGLAEVFEDAAEDENMAGVDTGRGTEATEVDTPDVSGQTIREAGGLVEAGNGMEGGTGGPQRNPPLPGRDQPPPRLDPPPGQPADPDLVQHRMIIDEIEMFVEEDIIFNMGKVTPKFLADRIDKAEIQRERLRTSVSYIKNHAGLLFDTTYSQPTKHMRRALHEFVLTGQGELLEARRLEAEQPRNITERAQESARAIKAASVTRWKTETVAKLEELTNSLGELKLEVGTDQAAFRKEERRCKELAKEVEAATKEANRLRGDAVDAGMSAAALDFEDKVRTMLAKQALVNSTMAKERRERNLPSLTGTGGSGRSCDVSPPTFSGAVSDDFFKFEADLTEYAAIKSPSREEMVRVILTKCLKGEALQACEHMEDQDTIMKYLKGAFGNPKLVLARLLEQIGKIGHCTGDEVKKRTWAMNTRSKLLYVQSLAVKHGLEKRLYHSQVTAEIQHRLNDKLQEEFCLLLEKVEQGKEVPQEKVFATLITFLDTLVSRFNFRLNMNTRFGEIEYLGSRTGAEARRGAPVNPPTRRAYHNEQQDGYERGSEQADWREHNGQYDVRGRGVQQVDRRGHSGGYGGEQEVFSVTVEAVDCKLCPNAHTYLYYCTVFQKAGCEERYGLARRAAVCFRCLMMTMRIDFEERKAWFEKHREVCDTLWACKQGRCGDKVRNKQQNFLLCLWHADKNKGTEADFIKSLD